MGNRSYSTDDSIGRRHLNIDFQLLPNGASTPTLGEGDPNGSYVTSLAHSTTGKWTFNTVDPYVAVVIATATLCLAAPTTATNNSFLTWVKNANFTFTFTLWNYTAGALADVAQS